MIKTVLVVVAHADDEVLGCGGTIARHVAEGDLVHVVFMADGVGSRVESNSGELQRRNQARDEGMRILGVPSDSSSSYDCLSTSAREQRP